MIALIPIFLDKSDEIYASTTGNKLIGLFLESAKRAKWIEKIVVVTNDESIHKLLDKYRNETFLVEIRKKYEMDSANILPWGTDSAIQYLKRTFVKNSYLTVLNFRNPLISSRILDDAMNQFFSSDRNLMLSVREIKDNPCQLFTYYKIMDVRTIFLTDTDVEKIRCYGKSTILLDKFDEKNRLVTHPFYFDWDSKKISQWSACGVYFRKTCVSEIMYVPIESLTDRNRRFCEDSIFFIYDTNSSARLLSYSKTTELDFPQGEYSAAGIQLAENSTDFSIIKNEKDEHFIHVSTPLELIENYILKIHKIYSSSKIDVIENDLIINSGKHLYKIPGDMSDCTGLITSILTYSENDDCDLVEPFKQSEKLWDVDGQDRLINTKTGKMITGRQGFPETFEPDGSFFIMSQETGSSFIPEGIGKNSNAYVLKENESVQIRSRLEYMHYRAIQKASLISP